MRRENVFQIFYYLDNYLLKWTDYGESLVNHMTTALTLPSIRNGKIILLYLFFGLSSVVQNRNIYLLIIKFRPNELDKNMALDTVSNY